jgi:hypothetical protein
VGNETAVTAHVHKCVELVSERLERNVQNCDGALDAVFQLVDMPWDELAEDDKLFREGYETAVLDVVEAIANEWGIELPQLKVRHEPGQ